MAQAPNSRYEFGCEGIRDIERASQLRQLSQQDYRRVAEAMFRTPACFTPEQWEDWKEAARLCAPSPFSTFCEDCRPEFHEQMVAANRCAFPAWECVDGVGRRVLRIRAEHVYETPSHA